MDEDDLILINLALAIALCADPRPDCDTAREIYSHCKEVLDCKLASTVTNINHIVIVLLMVGPTVKFRCKVSHSANVSFTI